MTGYFDCDCMGADIIFLADSHKSLRQLSAVLIVKYDGESKSLPGICTPFVLTLI